MEKKIFNNNIKILKYIIFRQKNKHLNNNKTKTYLLLFK